MLVRAVQGGLLCREVVGVLVVLRLRFFNFLNIIFFLNKKGLSLTAFLRQMLQQGASLGQTQGESVQLPR